MEVILCSQNASGDSLNMHPTEVQHGRTKLDIKARFAKMPAQISLNVRQVYNFLAPPRPRDVLQHIETELFLVSTHIITRTQSSIVTSVPVQQTSMPLLLYTGFIGIMTTVVEM